MVNRFVKRTRIKLLIWLTVVGIIFIYFKCFHKPEKNEINYPPELQILEDKIRRYEGGIIPNLGNYGEPAFLKGPDKEKGEEALKHVALNTVLSDHMPLNRTLKDNRHKKLDLKKNIYFFS